MEKCMNSLETETVPESKKFSAVGYFRDLLTDSVVTGVPQIIAVSNLIRKIFKVIVLFGCIIGFIYQTVAFMKLYYTYPSVVEIELRYEKDLPPPAVTVCNRNQIQRTKFCQDYEHLCITPKNLTKFCSMHPLFCTETTQLHDLKFIKSDIYLEDMTLTPYEQRAEDLVHDCCLSVITFLDQCRKTLVHHVYDNENKSGRDCYTIDLSKIERGNDTFKEMVNKSLSGCILWGAEGFTIVLDLDPGEYIRPDMIPAAQVVLHSNDEVPNPFTKGFNAEIGKRYTARLSVIEEKLLPPPYPTKCVTEYEDVGMGRPKCLDACYAKLIIDACGCEREGDSSEGNRKCTLEDLNCMDKIDYEICYDNCPRLCKSTYFQYEISSANIEIKNPVVDLGDGPVYDSLSEDKREEITRSEELQKNLHKMTIISIEYAREEVTIHTYKPKYDRIEILGFIGGYSGIWLGVSLVAVFDFFETLTVFVCFICRKHKNKKFSISK